jgi:hypothetical protein
VAPTKRSGTTRLTEAQAKALADWWGGKYHEAIGLESQGKACHGVIFTPDGKQERADPVSRQLAIFSLEEARALENTRTADNPGAPDWVG